MKIEFKYPYFEYEKRKRKLTKEEALEIIMKHVKIKNISDNFYTREVHGYSTDVIIDVVLDFTEKGFDYDT